MKKYFFMAAAGLWLIPFQSGHANFSQNYSDFYEQSLKSCRQQAQQLGFEENCFGVQQNCLTWVIACAQEKYDCVLQVNGNSPQWVCGSTPTCHQDLSAIILKYKADTAQPCAYSAKLSIDKPGCGNKVLEPGELCDNGDSQKDNDCPANCGKAVVVDAVAPVDTANSGGPAAPTGNNPGGAPPEEVKKETVEAAKGCAFVRLEAPIYSSLPLMLLALVSGWLLLRLRKMDNKIT